MNGGLLESHQFYILDWTRKNYQWLLSFNSTDVLRPDFCLMDLDILNIHTKTNSISNDGGEITLKSYAV